MAVVDGTGCWVKNVPINSSSNPSINCSMVATWQDGTLPLLLLLWPFFWCPFFHFPFIEIIFLASSIDLMQPPLTSSAILCVALSMGVPLPKHPKRWWYVACWQKGGHQWTTPHCFTITGDFPSNVASFAPTILAYHEWLSQYITKRRLSPTISHH